MVSIVGAVAGIYEWLFIIVPALAVAAYTVVYSYVEFRREQDNGTPE
jgi:hypothetical protein